MTHFEPGINHKIWLVVTAIPSGRVATYGGLAKKAGMAGGARRVGRALRDLPPNTNIPWHRVINSSGRISLPTGSTAHAVQRQRLEAEGISFKENGSIDLRRYGW